MELDQLHSDAYSCPLCSTHFASKTAQVEHLDKDHGFPTPWICHECEISYADKASFESHEQGFHPAPLTGSIDPQLLLLNQAVRGTSASDLTGLVQNQNLSDYRNTAPLIHATQQSLGLPASIFDYGFQPKDFDPQTRYSSASATKERFRPFPPDLAEEHIFNADPRQISYGNLLRIATKHTNTEIVQKVNAGRPEKALKSVQTLESRLRTALEWKANQEKTPGGVEELKKWFERERAKNGVRYRRNKTEQGGDSTNEVGSSLQPPMFGTFEARVSLPTPKMPPEQDVRAASLPVRAKFTATNYSQLPATYPVTTSPAANRRTEQRPGESNGHSIPLRSRQSDRYPGGDEHDNHSLILDDKQA